MYRQPGAHRRRLAAAVSLRDADEGGLGTSRVRDLGRRALSRGGRPSRNFRRRCSLLADGARRQAASAVDEGRARKADRRPAPSRSREGAIGAQGDDGVPRAGKAQGEGRPESPREATRPRGAAAPRQEPGRKTPGGTNRCAGREEAGEENRQTQARSPFGPAARRLRDRAVRLDGHLPARRRPPAAPRPAEAAAPRLAGHHARGRPLTGGAGYPAGVATTSSVFSAR